VRAAGAGGRGARASGGKGVQCGTKLGTVRERVGAAWRARSRAVGGPHVSRARSCGRPCGSGALHAGRKGGGQVERVTLQIWRC